MLFITLFSLCFKPWEACLPSEVLLEIIEILEKMIHNEMRRKVKTVSKIVSTTILSKEIKLFYPITFVYNNNLVDRIHVNDSFC